MKFVIVFALLCCCYAAEQSIPAIEQEGRQPPQHIKNFVEQHIKLVKQQIPLLLRKQIEEGKVKVEAVKPNKNDQQVPENIKKFIKSHITKILEYIAHNRKEFGLRPTSDVSPFVVQKIETLKEDIKAIMQQIETHIPQVINQQIAYKNQLTNNQQNRDKEKNVGQQVQQHVAEVIRQQIDKKEEINKPVLQTLAAENLAQAESQHAVQIQKNEAHARPAVSDGIGSQTLQNSPQVVRQHDAEIEKITKQEKTVVPGHVQSVVEQIHQHVPQVIKQHIKQVENKDDKENSIEPEHIQAAVQQVHQHVPQIIKQIADEDQKKNEIQENSETPSQSILQQTHLHLSPVLSRHIAQIDKKKVQANSTKPSNIEGVVQQIHQDIPQLINHGDHHVAQEQTHIVIPNQPTVHTINTQAEVSDIHSSPSHIRGHLHPIVQEVDQLTQNEAIGNSNIVPSHVQYLQNHYHISPVRTT